MLCMNNLTNNVSCSTVALKTTSILIPPAGNAYVSVTPGPTFEQSRAVESRSPWLGWLIDLLNLCPWTVLNFNPLVSMTLHSQICVPLGRLFSYHIWRSRQPSPSLKHSPWSFHKKNNATWYPSLRQSHRPIPSPSLHSAELRSNCESLYARMKIPKSFKYQVLPVFFPPCLKPKPFQTTQASV